MGEAIGGIGEGMAEAIVNTSNNIGNNTVIGGVIGDVIVSNNIGGVIEVFIIDRRSIFPS